jgi:protein-S-isoprenylcysteine O-methyltransferase Ste14
MSNKILKGVKEAIIPCLMLAWPVILGVLFAFGFEIFFKRLPINWVLVLGLCAAFCVGIVIGIWIDNDIESPAEW